MEYVFGFLRNRYLWVMFITILITLVAIQNTSAERKETTVIEKLVRDAYTPLQRGVSAFRGQLDRLENLFVDKARLASKVKVLEEELKSYRLENQSLREYKFEARRLQQLLDFKDRNLSNMKLIPAQVIARNPSTWYNTITIDRGKSDGISRNMAVITPQGLVGRVTLVESDYAVVILITDREAAVGAMVQETRVPGIIVGTGTGERLKLSQIPFYSKVEKGSRVVTSRFSELYPPGILIGKIQSVSAEPEALTRMATVIPAVDLDQVEEVLVVKDYVKPAAEWGELLEENPDQTSQGINPPAISGQAY